jgi:hypothetical protein
VNDEVFVFPFLVLCNLFDDGGNKEQAGVRIDKRAKDRNAFSDACNKPF